MISRRAVAAIATCFVAGAFYPFPAHATTPKPAGPSQYIGAIQIWGHRATRSGATENTMAALEIARKAGAYGVEVDFRLTKDGRWVLSHDSTLNRSTSCSGKVSSKTAVQVQKCRPNQGSYIPTLEQVAAWAARTGMRVDADMKSTLTSAQADRFAATVKAAGATGLFMPNGLANEAPLKARGMTPAYISPTGTKNLAGYVVVKVDINLITAAQVTTLHQQGHRVLAYGVTSTTLLAKAFGLHLDGAMVDNPVTAVQWIRSQA